MHQFIHFTSDGDSSGIGDRKPSARDPESFIRKIAGVPKDY
jgi:hypothetical protein